MTDEQIESGRLVSRMVGASGEREAILAHFRKYAQKLNDKCLIGGPNTATTDGDVKWLLGQMMRAQIIEMLCQDIEAEKHRGES